MKTSLFLILALLLVLNACSNNDVKKFDNQVLAENKFKNASIQKIVDFQNDRNTKALIAYFENSDPLLRETAVLALASVQDKSAIESLLKVLENDESLRIRKSAAFSIGQIGKSEAVTSLIRILNKEESNSVRAILLESLGKCGNDSTLAYLLESIKKQSDKELIDGALLGFARLSLKNIFSNEAVEQIVSILSNNKYNDETKYNASISLARLKDFDLTSYYKGLCDGFSNTTNPFVKMNIISAFSNIKNTESIDFLNNTLQSADDYRIKVNAIKSLNHFEYGDVKKIIFQYLNDTNVNIAIQASEFFLTKTTNKDADVYFNYAQKVKNWRVKSNLLSAALKSGNSKVKISSYIKTNYLSANNIYEKAALLKSLGGDIANFQFVNIEMANIKNFIIRNSGLEGLVEMRRNPDFNSFNIKWKAMGKPDLSKEFAETFKIAIKSGDIALVAIAAEVIRDPELDFRKIYTNSYFLEQALNNCKLPQEIETYRELQKTIAFINGSKEPEPAKLKPVTPDWKYIAQIPYNQQIEINTSKGRIHIELHVNQSPVSVSNFLKLINQDYFDNKTFHRTVPNFVIQDGCPRGDGWGGPDYVISSEFAMNYYTEGSLGMASAGKDTESSQWFITHSPTPHLDGRYSNFGTVIKGMEIVHLLEVGDTIRSIEIIGK